MKTRKLLYWFAAIVLLGLIEYATATTNIFPPEAHSNMRSLSD